ncbi:MAG: DNA-binding domain-containing protein [Candidatus Sphingomonas phytovorans]|nr:DNA-binding domain-containing protein [Sphingomonas sp.]WEJ98462.1 MAG: DNA-binding domain-containing protein [Sphingomonas sp.]
MTLLAMQRDFGAWLKSGSQDSMDRIGRRHAPGLRVYQNNYRAQLVACLEQSFPHTLAWIGGEAFHAAVVTHIESFPPSSWTLDAYPRDFPATLAALNPDDPEIAELAWIELALGEAFVGPDAPAIAPDQVAAVDWDAAILRFTPTLDHRASITNAPALWSALDAGEMPPPVAMLPEAGAILVWRHAQISRFRAIDAEEFGALTLARAGMPFASLCAALVEQHGEESGIALAGTLLGRWLGDGLLCDIVADGESMRQPL